MNLQAKRGTQLKRQLHLYSWYWKLFFILYNYQLTSCYSIFYKLFFISSIFLWLVVDSISAIFISENLQSPIFKNQIDKSPLTGIFIFINRELCIHCTHDFCQTFNPTRYKNSRILNKVFSQSEEETMPHNKRETKSLILQIHIWKYLVSGNKIILSLSPYQSRDASKFVIIAFDALVLNESAN